MRRFVSSFRFFVFIWVFATLFSVGSASTPVVQWGEATNIVTGLRVLPDSGARALPFGGPNSPTSSDYYAGNPLPTDRSARFRATAFTVSGEPGATASVRVLNNHTAGGETADALQFALDAGAGVPLSGAGLAFWTKEEAFLNGYETVAVPFDRLRVRVSGNLNTQPPSPGATRVRLVVREGASFYVSSPLGTFPTGGNGWSILESEAVTAWHTYDPHTDIMLIGGAAAPALADVTGIGYLYEVESFATTRWFNCNVREFSVVFEHDGPNQDPVAAPDTATVEAGASVRIAVLANDSDPDGDPLRIASVGPVSEGSVAIDGRDLVYTAPLDFVGAVVFSYTVADVRGGTDSSTVTVSVTEALPWYPHTVTAEVAGVSFAWMLESRSADLSSGLFVDGQPWIVAPAGGLRLVGTHPARLNGQSVGDREGNTVTADIHITVVNPPVGDFYEDILAAQPRLAPAADVFGWDSRGAIRYGVGRRYDPALGWNGVTPLALLPGDSVTTPKSFVDMVRDASDPANLLYHETVLEAVAVLTVLSEPPPADAFRPGVVRSPERRAHPHFFRYTDIIPDVDDYLIGLPATNLVGAPVDFSAPGIPPLFSAARLTSLMSGPAIMNIGFNDSQGTHGYLNNSGATYSADVSMRMGDLAIGALAAWLTPEERAICRVRLLQRCIDAYEAFRAGLILAHDGGMMTAYGARMALAGRLLDYEGMRALDKGAYGRPPWYFFGDYSQMIYVGHPEHPGPYAPPVGDVRFVAWDAPDHALRIEGVAVKEAGPAWVAVPDGYVWPIYRAARELPNFKLRVASGPGAGTQVYTVTGIADYVNATNNEPGDDVDTSIRGGRLTVKPTWQNGQPGAASTLEFFPATRAEANRWTFKSWGNLRNNRFITYNRDIYTLSPQTDYGGINLGAYLSLLIALHALDAADDYTAGVDKWMMAAGEIPGYGEFLFNSNRSRLAGDPLVRSGLLERALLGGLWKEVVLDPAGRHYLHTGGSLASLPAAGSGVVGDSIGNGLADAWELAHFGFVGVDPDADADGDGQSNRMEFLGGSDPTGPASAFRPQLIFDDLGRELSFPTRSGTVYRVLESPDLRTWSLRALVEGDGAEARVELPPGPGPLFWRVRLTTD
ncbi:MAG: cadherin-like domain-containing protein [Opitutales bacterium]|nr:cadherin-like domain-containing protein [Opitutales bacterium]